MKLLVHANREDYVQWRLSFVFSKNNEDDLEWFRKRWKAMSDRLKDNWIHQVFPPFIHIEGR